MSRFAIQNANKLFFTYNFIPETIYVPRPDNPTVADPRSLLVPLFEAAHPLGALKFDTAADAKTMLSHPHLNDPKAFDRCFIVEIEFDSLNTAATRGLIS